MLLKFHFDILSFIIDKNPEYVDLMVQLPFLTLTETEHTGVGCFYTYSLDTSFDLSKMNFAEDDIILDMSMSFNSDKLPNGAMVVFYIRNKKIDTLEILSNGTDYPIEELEDYAFESRPINYIQLKTNANSG